MILVGLSVASHSRFTAGLNLLWLVKQVCRP
jgi:hypothetical protein